MKHDWSICSPQWTQVERSDFFRVFFLTAHFAQGHELWCFEITPSQQCTTGFDWTQLHLALLCTVESWKKSKSPLTSQVTVPRSCYVHHFHTVLSASLRHCFNVPYYPWAPLRWEILWTTSLEEKRICRSKDAWWRQSKIADGPYMAFPCSSNHWRSFRWQVIFFPFTLLSYTDGGGGCLTTCPSQTRSHADELALGAIRVEFLAQGYAGKDLGNWEPNHWPDNLAVETQLYDKGGCCCRF